MSAKVLDNELLAVAQEAHKNEQYKKAARYYSRILKNTSSHPIALNNLAAILISQGRAQEAERLLTRALSTLPKYSDAIANMAACQGLLEEWDKCYQWCKKAISFQPLNPMPWLWLAKAHKALSNEKDAVVALETCLANKIQDEKHGLSIELASLLFLQGKRARAIRHLIKQYQSSTDKEILLRAIHAISVTSKREQHFTRAILDITPKDESCPELQFWKAKSLLAMGEEAEAIEKLMSVVHNKPSHAEAWMELGLILKKQRNLPKAIACIRRSIKEDKTNAKSWQELTSCLIEAEEHKQAILESARSRKQFPKNLEILISHCSALIEGGKAMLAINILKYYTNLRDHEWNPALLNCEGLCLIRLKEYEAAVERFRRAMKDSGADPGHWSNRGMAYGLMGRHRPEIFCYRKAIQCKPDDPGSHVNLGMAYLAKQNFGLGLEEYEWRLKRNGGSLNAGIHGQMATKGEEPEEIIVITEQGLGDTLHFSRYLYDLRKRLPSSKITLACPLKLSKLLKESIRCVDEVISCEEITNTRLGAKYLPLMSIPYFCNLNPLASSAPIQYISVKEEAQKEARLLIRSAAANESIVIGLHWKGNPATERTNLRGRSMALENMRLLAKLLPDAVFVSLQKGAGNDEIKSCSFRDRFIQTQEEVSKELCFVETAAHVMACDHIITTDTSLAHLSGALGQRTHILLTKRPEWRWRCDNKWYQHAQLNYQKNEGSWDEPLAEAAHAIRGHQNL